MFRRSLKKLPELYSDISRICPEAKIEIWSQDEARLGLIPILRRVWAPKGKRPIAIGKRRYQWVYLYGFVHPETGNTEWLILPTVNQNAFEVALNHFAKAIGAGPNKRIILVVDGAGWHKGNIKIPEGVHLLPLPAYSPELQPAERLWPLVRESLANKDIDTLDDLEEMLVQRCRYLIDNIGIVKSSTFFHWWPESKSD